MRFKTTTNIFKDFGEYFDPNWMSSNKIELPPKKDWDYSRELQIEDVDIWEVIYEQSGGTGVYAAWNPYAEFFMVIVRGQVETYYGIGAEKFVQKRMKELGIPFALNQVWVEPDQMYLYQ